MKKAIFLSAIIAMVLTGCAKEEELLVVGTEATFPPFEYVGGEDGAQITGFDMEIAEQIAKDSGKKLKIENIKFDSLVIALNSGKIDMIAAGMTITDERLKKVNFSTPYFEATQLVVVNKENTSVNVIGDLKGKRIAVQLGTTGDIMAQTLTKNVIAFNTVFDAIKELNNHKVDIALIDKEPAANYLAKNPNLKPVSLKFDAEYYGIAVAKDDQALLKQIDKTLKNMKNNGHYDALISKYMK